MQRLVCAALLLPALSLGAGTPSDPQALANGVLEILQRRCAGCHGSAATTPKEFQLIDDLTKLRASRYVNLRDPENSELYKQVVTLEMPRRTSTEKAANKDVEPLKPEEVAAILSWIKHGAPDGKDAADTLATTRQTDSNNASEDSGGFQAYFSTYVSISPLAFAQNCSVHGPALPIAKRELVSEKDVFAAALEDLLSLPDEDRSNIRYVSLAPQYNNIAEVKDEQLEIMRNGVRKMLNSLSTNPRIATFAEVGPEKVLFRVKLRDLGWETTMWEHVASFYPYGVQSGGMTALGGVCHSTTPVLRADWMAANAMRAPLYHDILGIPATTEELERKLGVDLNKMLAEGRVVRAGFTHSGVSLSNRLIERVDTGAYAGAYWKSYDFRHSSGKGRLQDFPLGPSSAHLCGGTHAFEHAGGEIVFSLPNGLHGYMLADALGNRLDGAAPTNIVGDRNGTIAGRVEVSSGLSCIVCHERGIKTSVPPDEVRAVAGSSAFSPEEQRLIEQLHPDPKKMQEWLVADQERFMNALQQAEVAQKGGREPIYALDEIFERPVTMAEAAAELGLKGNEFDAKVMGSSALFDIHIQLAGAGIPRDAFVTKFADLVQRLNLGTVRGAAPLVEASRPAKANPRNVPISVALGTNKAHYKNGENLVAYVKTAEDCHLRLLYRDAAGSIILLFPNKFHPDSRIPGAREVQIPSAADNFDIPIEAPNGAESLVAVVSSQPFTDEAAIQDALLHAPDPEKVLLDMKDRDLEVVVAKSARVRAREARLGFARVNLITQAR